MQGVGRRGWAESVNASRISLAWPAGRNARAVGKHTKRVQVIFFNSILTFSDGGKA